MPELPEVETIVRDLAQFLVGRSCRAVQVLNLKSINLTAAKFRQQVLHQPISEVSRRGKHIVIKLPQNYLVIHLKMTGQLIWRDKRHLIVGGHPIKQVGEELPNKFTRVVFDFASSGQLFFNDVRKFGWLKIMTPAEAEKYWQRLGLDPLSKEFSLVFFKKLLASRPKSRLKALLLDQSRLSGLGNIYVDESLFLANLRPDRLVGSLTALEQKKLWQAIPKVLRLSLRYRGTSFNNYRDAQGQSGQFVNHLQVYGRAGQPCLVCGRALSKTRLAGRGTHWCQSCQH